MTPASQVGIVVIGRNEAPRLPACLASVRDHLKTTVYVDSGSVDGSADIAERAGVTTIRLQQGPYTAARGREVGWRALAQRFPQLKYVQFIDGDCVLLPGWLERAVGFLDEHADVGVVVGALRERHAEQSTLVRLVNADWELPTGPTDAIGGIAMVRVAALQQVNGWRIDLIAGEDLDLGIRIIGTGWRLERLPEGMTLHDIGIQSWTELWRRSIRSGFVYAQLCHLHGKASPRWVRQLVSSSLYGGVFPVSLAMSLILWWPAAFIVLVLYIQLIGRMTYRRLQRGDHWSFALLYSLTLVMHKLAGVIGMLKFIWQRTLGTQPKLMEYKSATAES